VHARTIAGGMLLALALGDAAAAQESGVATPDQPTADNGATSPHDGDFWTRDALTGNWGGERSALENAGVLIAADSIDETLGNVSGGIRTGAIYEGRLEVLATLKLDQLIGWTGATLHTNAYQIHGRGLSANDVGNLMTVSNIEAMRTMRLYDLWIEQVLADGAVSIRAGQIAADDEFFISQYAANFINGTLGWPTIMANDLPSGGPAYPLATPGVRVNVAPTNELTLSSAVLNGNPAGAGTGDPQRRDAGGTAFRVNDGALFIGEASYETNQDKNATGLPASYKLGAWYNSNQFADQRFDNIGRSLAAPTSSGVPAQHPGDYGAYAVIDQGLWQDKGAGRSFGVFARLGGAPSDRNLIALYADAGFNFQGLFASRADDVFGAAIAFAQISNRAQALDQDTRAFSGINSPMRDGEMTTEVMYRYQATPWWSLQPDAQFIRHPGGNVALSTNTTKAIPNAFVVGLRSAILF
jgi:porin